MVDTRDLRDPQKLGEWLLGRLNKRYTASQYYDGSKPLFPNYPQDESMAVLTAREYRAELEERKKAGDKYAASAIAALDKGGKVEYDDPSGN